MNIVITGATSAIGSVLARLLYARGETLLLCGRSDDKLAALNEALGGAHRTLATDLTGAEGGAALQASAAQASHITGQVLRIDGGQGMLRPLPRAIKA